MVARSPVCSMEGRNPTELDLEYIYGLVTGAIGVGSGDEPLNFSGERLLSFEFVDQPKLPSQEMHDCATKVPVGHDNINVTWMAKPHLLSVQLSRGCLLISAVLYQWTSPTMCGILENFS